MAVSDKMNQQGKHLRFNLYWLAATAELEPLLIETEVTKCPSHSQEYSTIADTCSISLDIHQALRRNSR
jgi:hypothetical protein